MGSSSSTNVDDLDLWGMSEVDEDSLSIFLERDRRLRDDPSQRADDFAPEHAYMSKLIEYAVPADEMQDRLDALGFTLKRAQADYERCLQDECDMVQEWLEEGTSYSLKEYLEALKAATFEHWKKALRKVAKKKVPLWHHERLREIPEAQVLRFENDYGVPGAFSDRRLFLRAYLAAVPTAKEVVLDVTDLVHGGYYGYDDLICESARSRWTETHPIYGSIVILTEGRSDSRILDAAFRAMSPHLADLFGFLDFEGLRTEGGAETLAKTVRAFVGARLSSRVVAIFDNNTAGAEALSSLQDFTLPPNIKIMSLPTNDLARAYPTVGPQGVVVMNVNGLAASIEMYLGSEALTADDGELHPVRWTGWRHRLKRCQGAVEQKSQIQDRFLQMLSRTQPGSAARDRFPDLARLVDHIAFAFAE